MTWLRLFIVLSLVTSASLMGESQLSSLRTWTDEKGRQISATYAGIEGDKVLLTLADARTVPYEIAKLSPSDQAFIKTQTHTTSTTPASKNAPTKRPPLNQRTWPDKVEVPARSVETKIVNESDEKREFIYQTETFEFNSQAKLAKSVVTEIAQTFEATRLLLTKLPWGLDCQPPTGQERYRACLYETRDDYVAAGGPINSGGVYMTNNNIFLVPFQSIGLEKRGQTYFKNKTFRNDTLVHEITHQVMDDYLDYLPRWVIEGTAEYTEILPDSANGFLVRQHETGLKKYLKFAEEHFQVEIEIPSLEEHMTMDVSTWMESTTTPQKMFLLYMRSCLLVYYFNHLDGDGKSTRFMKYMDRIYEDVQAKRAFFARPEVTSDSEGNFRYPAGLTPPPRGENAEHLTLLTDGRSYPDLARDIVEKYRQIGVKVIVR
jgi:hypothetical protein